VAALLYIDTSALLDRVLGQKRHTEIAVAMHDHGAAGGRLVSSRLLHLEARRVEVRERLAGHDLSSLAALAGQINALPVTEEVWSAAHAIEQHTRTLDSIHLATCKLVGAELLCSDAAMSNVADALGIALHPVSGGGRRAGR